MSGISVGPVQRTPRLSDVVRDRLLDAIRDADLPAGAKLPSERELAERFGVSRTVVREAVRDLVAQGVLDGGSGTGARVARTDDGPQGSFAQFLRRRNLLDPDKLYEVRETLELKVVALATQRASDEDLALVRRAHLTMVEAGGDPEAASRADVDFHRSIAKAADNDLFLLLVDSLRDVLLEMRLATLALPGRLESVCAQHDAVITAIEQRDPDAAVTAMRKHLKDSLRAFQRANAPVRRTP